MTPTNISFFHKLWRNNRLQYELNKSQPVTGRSSHSPSSGTPERWNIQSRPLNTLVFDPSQTQAQAFHSLGKILTTASAWLQLFFIFSLPAILLSCTTINQKNDILRSELIEIQLSIASNHLNTSSPEKALAVLKQLVAKFPNHPRVLTILGMTHLALNNSKPAVTILRHAYKEDSTIASGLNLSSALIANNKTVAARNVLRKMLKRKTKYEHKERLLHNMGVSYLKEKQTASAKKYFKQALEHNPTYYMSLLQLAKIANSSHKTRPMVDFLQRSVRACTTCYESVRMLATTYIRNETPKKALAVLNVFLKEKSADSRDKENAHVLRRLAQTQERKALRLSKTNQHTKPSVSRSRTDTPTPATRRSKYKKRNFRLGADYKIYNSRKKIMGIPHSSKSPIAQSRKAPDHKRTAELNQATTTQ